VKFFTLFLAVILLHETASAEMRIWRQKDGSAVEGEYMRYQSGRVYLKDPNRKTHSIVIEKANLCDEDLRYLSSKIPPEVDIKFRVKLSKEKGEYADPDATCIDTKITLTKISKEPFTGTLTAELYLVRKEIATDDYRILAKKLVGFQFPNDTANSVFETELSSKARTIFGAPGGADEDRGWTYEGYLIVVLAPDGEIIKYKTDLQWLTQETLGTFRKMPTYWFFDKNFRKVSTPRPSAIGGSAGD